jgi:hypothetical protein
MNEMIIITLNRELVEELRYYEVYYENENLLMDLDVDDEVAEYLVGIKARITEQVAEAINYSELKSDQKEKI